MRVRRGTGNRPLAALGAVLLSASLALAGCGAGGSDDAKSAGKADKNAAAAPQGGAAKDTASRPGDDGARKPSAKQAIPPASRVIRTAELTLDVPDVGKALAAGRAAAVEAGGYVGDETTERDERGHVVSHVVLRVPEATYDSVLARLSGTGELLGRKAKAQDVTDQVVDVESRITTQRSSVARVRELMDRAGQLSEVVTLEGELSRRQADLDALLAQQASLKDRTSLATITLGLTASGPVKESDGGGPGVLDAVTGGWHVFVTALRWLVMALGAVAPFAGVLAVGYAVWRWGVRPRMPRRSAPALAADASSEKRSGTG
ncbi:DUF4349 domain-containing protein [Streptomyces sp. TLI_146]|uniref:DUF4349 domain-containing protein n=1 Tax=Streptomyces sp. TLI_146 TaxID=1938858 RepID=UPI000C6FD6C2|nr:DUF4349 domain-containing protein [Streptomyces sp. TLI_146]PKV89740.1 uncharacterized protein DUF4349 [Streptomyces sp. TLI_146]